MRAVKEERRDWEKDRDVANDTKLWGIASDQSVFEKRLFLRAKHTGFWMSIWGITVTGTVIAATEFRGF